MISALVGLYTLYVLIKLYVSVMQIGYINQVKVKAPHLMDAQDYIKAGNYAVAKERMNMVSTFIEYLVFIAWIGGGLQWLDTLISFESEAVKSIVLVLGFVVINSIITMPLEWYEKFSLDEKYGFNRSSLGLYIKDTIISAVIGLSLGAIVIWVIYLIMISTQFWWLWSFIFIFGVVILINMLFPTVRALFFDKIKPLDDTDLNTKISELMNATGFVSSGVYVSDASKRDARLNAYFGGLGKSKRVILFDTLLEKLSHQELLAVLGHELGHYAHGDIYKNIAMVGAMLFGLFAFFGNIPSDFYLELGISEQPYIVMILLMMLMPILSFIMMPIMGMVSRHNEYAADETGSELGGKENLANALKKLVSENKSFPLSHPIYIFFYYTHPPVLERLRVLGVNVETDNSGLEGSCPSID